MGYQFIMYLLEVCVGGGGGGGMRMLHIKSDIFLCKMYNGESGVKHHPNNSSFFLYTFLFPRYVNIPAKFLPLG